MSIHASQPSEPAGPPVCIECPHCKRSYRVPERFIGRRAICKDCKQPFLVAEDVSLWRAAMDDASARFGGYDDKADQRSAMSRG